MKASFLTIVLVALSSAIASSSTAAPSGNPPGRMHAVKHVLRDGHPAIVVGTSSHVVREAIGSANKQLTPNLWLYHRFEAIHPKVGKDDCRQLVIHFVQNRVASMYLVDPRAREVVVSRLRAGASESVALRTASPNVSESLAARD